MPPRPGRRWAAAMAVALAAGGALPPCWFAIDLGMRPDIAAALQTWRFLLKLAVMLVAFGCALWACMRLAEPGTTLLEVAPALAAAPLLLAGRFHAGADARAARRLDRARYRRYSRICLVSIPMLSIAPLVALLIALRAGAPRSPSAAGAVAGGLAGGPRSGAVRDPLPRRLAAVRGAVVRPCHAARARRRGAHRPPRAALVAPAASWRRLLASKKLVQSPRNGVHTWER